jgi:hypothetical protein
MNWLIIGSVAVKHWFPDARVPTDIDILTPAKITGNVSNICVVDSQWHNAAEYLISINKDSTFADPDVLYTLKVSHAQWNIKWDKTMYDIEFLKRKGCTLIPDLHSKLVKIWSEIHGKKHVNMSKPMSDFFSDAVKREYDHEKLHELVSFYDRPIHERLREDHNTAWCSKELFFKMTFEDQCLCVLEEILVTAIERSKLTVNSKMSEKLGAMSKGYFQLATSMTSGWFALFLIEHRQILLFEKRNTWLTNLNTALKHLSS